MKSFSQFLSEATQSQASIRARKLGLRGDGHGGWLDRSGNLVARTEKGKLKFITKAQLAAEKAASEKRASAAPVSASPKGVGAPAPSPIPKKTKASPEKKEPAPSKEEQQQDDGGNPITVVFGRFNPPTKGHEKLLKTAEAVSVGGEIRIYPSRIQDSKKNPLDPDIKVSFMKKMFPEFKENIINDSDMNSIFDVLKSLADEGYTSVNIVVGSDRQAEIDNLAQKYNGDLYNFQQINVMSGGITDLDTQSSSAVSSSKLRKAVMDDDLKTFKRGIGKTLDDAETQSLFDAVRQGMGIAKSKVEERYALWQIAPKYDLENLREQYVKKNIFNLGEKVINLNTGLVGDIIRRGTNHLICVTEEGHMFKSWIKDVMEYTEVKMDSPMRDKIHPNTLVGTLGAFKHFASMTPGAIGTNAKYLQPGAKPYGVNLLNKYKSKKKSIR